MLTEGLYPANELLGKKDLLNKQLNVSSQHNVVTEVANVGFRGINKRGSKQD